MSNVRITTTAMAVAGLTLLGSGCAMFNDTATHISYTDNVSLGQELLDLQKAKEAGAISAEEFEILKREVRQRKGPVTGGVCGAAPRDLAGETGAP